MLGRQLDQLARQLSRAGVTRPAQRSMRELAAIALGRQHEEARAAVATRRMTTRTSARWVAGHPQLLAQWHPTKNLDLFPDEVTYGSRKRVWWICSAGPDHEWQAAPQDRTGRGRGCPFCANRRASATNSLAALSPKIAREWHPTLNGSLKPRDVVARSHRAVWWRCARDRRHVWRARLANRWWGATGCPVCAGKTVTTKNALASVRPGLCREWDAVRNRGITPAKVSIGSHRRVWWRCSRDPSHRWQAAIDDRAHKGSGCPVCSGRASVPIGARLGRARSLAESMPDLVREWDSPRNQPLTPKAVSRGSRRPVWWTCSRDPSHRWRAEVVERSRGSGCPVCAGKAPPPPGARLGRRGALAERAPELLHEWDRTQNADLSPREVGFRSSVRVWWRCRLDARHVWRAAVSDRTRGTGCPFCARAARRQKRASVA
jgi:hypothetical protein